MSYLPVIRAFVAHSGLMRCRALSKRVLRAASGVGQFALNGSVQRHKFWQLANSGGTPEDVYRISRQLFSTDSVTRITGRDGRSITRAMAIHEDVDVVNTISRLELKGYMTEHVVA